VSAAATNRIQTSTGWLVDARRGDLLTKIVAAMSLMTVCWSARSLVSSILQMESTINDGLALPEVYYCQIRHPEKFLREKTNNVSNCLVIRQVAKILLNLSQCLRFFLKRCSWDPTRHVSQDREYIDKIYPWICGIWKTLKSCFRSLDMWVIGLLDVEAICEGYGYPTNRTGNNILSGLSL